MRGSKPLETELVDQARPVFGASRAPIPALSVGEAGLWAAGTPEEEAAAHATVSTQEIEAALLDASLCTPLDLAQRLSQAKALFVPASLIAERIASSPHLQDLQRAAQRASMQAAFAKADALKRQLRIEQEQRRERNHGPRCGARTRTGSPCQRKVVMGRHRCPRHGGKPLTEEGRARIAEAQRRRWEAYREARSQREGSSGQRENSALSQFEFPPA
jgi:hypothetical protein